MVLLARHLTVEASLVRHLRLLVRILERPHRNLPYISTWIAADRLLRVRINTSKVTLEQHHPTLI